MQISKKGHRINSIEEWFAYAPPKKAECHWKDGRSAKELAKAWFPCAGRLSIPEEFSSLLDSSNVVGRIRLREAWPEVIVRFDPFRGEARNCDLLVRAVCDSGGVVISVEAKADETFNETVGKCYDAAMARAGSNAPERMRRLARAVLGADLEAIRSLRYQLLYGTAAALCAAKEHDATTAVFVVHEFVTGRTNDSKHQKNSADLDDFLRALTGDRNACLDPGRLVGPFRVPGNDDIPRDATLFIGKAIRNTRSGNTWSARTRLHCALSQTTEGQSAGSFGVTRVKLI